MNTKLRVLTESEYLTCLDVSRKLKDGSCATRQEQIDLLKLIKKLETRIKAYNAYLQKAQIQR